MLDATIARSLLTSKIFLVKNQEKVSKNNFELIAVEKSPLFILLTY